MMRIVYYYAKNKERTQTCHSNRSRCVNSKGTDANTLAYTLNDKTIRVLVKKGYFNKELSQIYNMSSTLSHENFHTQIRGKSREEEIQVIMRQMQAPEFKRQQPHLRKERLDIFKRNYKNYTKKIITYLISI